MAGLTATALGLSAGRSAAETAPRPPTRVLDDPRIVHGPVEFLHDGEPRLSGYLARPKAAGVFRGVLVVPGNTIAEEYIPNTCAALALAGFVGLAPQIFHFPRGSTQHTELDALDDIQAAASYLRGQPYVSTGGFGIVGFCVGGKYALLFGARSRDVDAVVAYHPGVLAFERLKRLPAPVQIHHGTGDTSVPYGESEALATKLRAQGNEVDLHLYQNAEHGFLAYTRPSYRPVEGAESWDRTVRFLEGRVRLES